MDIVNDAKQGDVIFEKDTLKLFLEQEANNLLSGATMDFSEEQGFVITGMARSSCCS